MADSDDEFRRELTDAIASPTLFPEVLAARDAKVAL
jgi:hypothetical protein